MIIDRDSWHWKLIRLVNDPWIERKIDDSCSYLRVFAFSVFKLIVFCWIIGFFIFTFSVAQIHFFGGLFGWPGAAEDLFMIGAALDGFLLACAVTIYSARKYALREVKPKEPGFILQAYDRIKNKYCSKVEFK